MSHTLLKSAKSVRSMVLQQVKAVPEELFDIKPAPFHNTIRWNVGHIIFVHDYLLSFAFSKSPALPTHYEQLFNTGTNPDQWSVNPPSNEELLSKLSDQLIHLDHISSDIFENRLTPAMELGPLTFETSGELFNFVTIHEAMHFSAISSLLQSVTNSRKA
ncbi:DinB superfamily protein [Fictibacillus solisalsi]|uniref:DinB superfamily protein n=1 Tax=Fictibacillus solisalsi TaxID=459525 RepID=A0A1G9ZZM0_9BACL|nr:DinB family protein [Fictibacillus solisalsi]SDN27062.1 DinB superfamily protein [Fictibacillus solisalsi]